MLESRVRAGLSSDLRFLVHLRDRPAQRDAGYIPTGGLIEHLEAGRVVVIEANDEPAGFLIYRIRRDGLLHVPSLCIDENLWRNGLGSRAMKFVDHLAKLRRVEAVTLKCAFDAPADAFWPTLGFQHVASSAARQRILKNWVLPILADPTRLPLPPRSCWGKDRLLADLETPNRQ